MATHIYTYTNPTFEKHLRSAVDVLSEDGLLAYPTDVNWACGCQLTSRRGLQRLQALKPFHPKSRPFSLLCSSIKMVAEYADLENSQYRLLRKILPGPYTILLRSHKAAKRLLVDRRELIGVRIPRSDLMLDLINFHEAPILSTSLAKGPAGEEILYGYELERVFGNRIDVLLDLGSEVPFLETTILDCSGGGVELVRQGVGETDSFRSLLSSV